MADTYVVEIQTPDGIWTDVSDLVDEETMGGYSYGIEDDLLQFRTGDIVLALHNDAQNTAAAIFDAVDPTLTYKLRIHRNDLKLFEGIVAVPGQISRSETDAEVELNAFGYLALLDQISAENVKRGFPSDYVTGTADDVIITFGTTLPTRFLQTGDKLRISNEFTSEEVEVLNGNGGDSVELKDGLTNSWFSTDGNRCELLTPWYRRTTIPFLVESLFYEAGVINPTLDFTGAEFAVPVATPVNTDGIDPTLIPTSLNEAQGKLRVRFTNNTEMEATNAVDGGFLAVAANVGGTSMQGIDDWRCYQKTEPAVLVTVAPINTSGANSKWQMGGVDYTASPPRAWGFRIRTITGGAGDTHHYELRHYDWQPGTKNWAAGVTEIADTPQTSESGPSGPVGCDLDPINGWVFFSYADLGTDAGDIKKLRYYDIVNDSLTTVKTGDGADGELRYSREAKVMLHLSGTTLTGYRGTEVKFQKEVPAGILLRTARYLPVAKKWVMIVRAYDRTKLLIADRYFVTQSLIEFSESASAQTPVTTYHPDDPKNFLHHFKNHVVGVIDGQYVVIDTLYAGVVDYADFTDRTVAGALVELAKLVNCVVWVDNDYNGFFVSRGSRIFNPEVQPKALDDLLLTQDDDLVWDKWYGRVTVTAPDGRAMTVGDASQAAGELDISTDLVPNLSLQSGLAMAYQAFYSRPRRSRTVTLDDDETIYFPLQIVTIGADEWNVYESEYSWSKREVRLRLVEADPPVGDETRPSLGPNLIMNPDKEVWTSDRDATHYASGTSGFRPHREAVIVHAGTYSGRLDPFDGDEGDFVQTTDAAAPYSHYIQLVSSNSRVVRVSFWFYGNNASALNYFWGIHTYTSQTGTGIDKSLRMTAGALTGWGPAGPSLGDHPKVQEANDSAWHYHEYDFVFNPGTLGVSYWVNMTIVHAGTSNTGPQSIYYDDLSLREVLED